MDTQKVEFFIISPVSDMFNNLCLFCWKDVGDAQENLTLSIIRQCGSPWTSQGVPPSSRHSSPDSVFSSHCGNASKWRHVKILGRTYGYPSDGLVPARIGIPVVADHHGGQNEAHSCNNWL